MEIAEPDEAAVEGSDEDAPVPAPAPTLGPQEVEAELYVKDAGMMLVSTVAPDFTWQSGNADIAIRCSRSVSCSTLRLVLPVSCFALHLALLVACSGFAFCCTHWVAGQDT